MRMKIFLALAATALIAYSGTASAECATGADLRLTIRQYHIDLNDNMPICVTVPGTFQIRINNPPGGGHVVHGGDVTVEQKVPSQDAIVLINGVNESPVNMLTVEVKLVEGKSVNVGDEFEFWIKIVGVGTLDPRIRVIPGGPE